MRVASLCRIFCAAESDWYGVWGIPDAIDGETADVSEWRAWKNDMGQAGKAIERKWA